MWAQATAVSPRLQREAETLPRSEHTSADAFLPNQSHTAVESSEGSEIFTLPVRVYKLASHSFVPVGSRHETPGPDTKDFFLMAQQVA